MTVKKFAPFEAPRSYEFKDPDTGFVQRASSLTELYKNITLYRIQNGLEPLEYLDTVVENYLCGLPENANKCKGVQLHRSVATYVKGGMVLLKNMLFPKFVTPAEAEARAKQCSTCKFNIFPDKGPFLGYADEIAISQVGERKTSLDKELGNCEVCTCVLRGKVHYGGTLDKFPPDQEEKLKSVNCWQLGIVK